MRAIPATRGYVAIVDEEDFYWLSEYKWRAVPTDKKGGRWTACRPVRSLSAEEGRGSMLMYRQIMRPPPGMVVDHIDGDPWNNRRSNLRICTHAENIRNQRKPCNGNTPFKGVSILGTKFSAGISASGRTYSLGTYEDATEAALAYDAAALVVHGEFARLNFPEAGTAPRHPERIVAELKAAKPASIMRRRAIERLRDGETASSIARSMGVRKWTVCTWGAAAGIKFRRGPHGGNILPSDTPSAPADPWAAALLLPPGGVAAWWLQ